MNKTYHVLCWRKMVGSQQTYDQKGLGKQRNPPKWVKRTISNTHDTIR